MNRRERAAVSHPSFRVRAGQAICAATGSQPWTFATGSSVQSLPAVANGVVYAGSGDGNLYAFDLAGGLAAPVRPNPSSLRPNYSLPEQR